VNESGRPRVEWVDVTKGIAMLLIVLYHSALISVQAWLAPRGWTEFNNFLTGIRMPEFFFSSGLLAVAAINRPWPQLWSRRMALLAWAFVLWTVIRFAYFLAVPMKSRPHETDWLDLLISPIWPTSGLWYLHALISFLILTKLLKRLPVVPLVTGALVVAVLFSSTLDVHNLSYNGMARYYVFFLLGYFLRERVLAATVTARPVGALIGVLLLGATLTAVDVADLRDVPGVLTLVGLIACAVGAVTARALVDTPLKRPLSYLGRRTLRVYVTHVILIAAALAVIDRWDLLQGQFRGTVPAVVATLAVALALLFDVLVARTPALRYLFEAPPWFAGQQSKQPDGTPSITAR
jgi:uncharacterized membrane protein YcfT